MGRVVVVVVGRALGRTGETKAEVVETRLKKWNNFIL